MRERWEKNSCTHRLQIKLNWERIGQCIIGIDNDSMRYDLLLAQISVRVCINLFLSLCVCVYLCASLSFARLFLFFILIFVLTCEWNRTHNENWLRQMNTKHTSEINTDNDNKQKKSARTNWKLKPFEMQYVVEMEKIK